MWFMTKKAVWSSGGSLSSWTLPLQMTLDSDSDIEEQKIREILQVAKKKKLAKAERKEARLRKGKQWLLTYTGSPKKMNKHYLERFHVDSVTAAKDLQNLQFIV